MLIGLVRDVNAAGCWYVTGCLCEVVWGVLRGLHPLLGTVYGVGVGSEPLRGIRET